MGGAKSTDRPAEPHVALGLGLRLVSALSLALMFAGVKWVGQRGAGVAETLFYRQIGSVVCAAAFVAFGPGFASLRTQRFRAHAMRMAIGVVAMLLNFLMVTLLPLAEATAIGFSVPIFATLLAAILLGEPTGRWRWGAVIAGFLGVLVIVQPGSGHIGAYGGLVALGAVVSTACATIAIRHLGATEAVATTVFWFGATSLIPLGLAMPFVARPHDAATFAAIAGLALAGGIAQLALTGALRLAPVVAGHADGLFGLAVGEPARPAAVRPGAIALDLARRADRDRRRPRHPVARAAAADHAQRGRGGGRGQRMSQCLLWAESCHCASGCLLPKMSEEHFKGACH